MYVLMVYLTAGLFSLLVFLACELLALKYGGFQITKRNLDLKARHESLEKKDPTPSGNAGGSGKVMGAVLAALVLWPLISLFWFYCFLRGSTLVNHITSWVEQTVSEREKNQHSA